VYVAGSFGEIGLAARSALAALDPATGLALPWNPDVDGGVEAILPFDDRVYLGGIFDHVGGSFRSRIAAVDTLVGAANGWDAGLQSGGVYALAAATGVVFAGGEFTNVAGVARANLAAITDPTLTVSVPQGSASQPGVRLAPPAPHPLRGLGTIAYDLPAAGPVDLALYDIAGRRVRVLVAGEVRAAGRHVVGWDASEFAAGVYLARLRVGGAEATRRVVVLGR
jgi:hypothetical protein